MSKIEVPKYQEYMQPIWQALIELGGSGTIEEIEDAVINKMGLSNEAIDMPHGTNGSTTELSYRMSWTRSYLKKRGYITNSSRGVWTIASAYQNHPETVVIHPDEIVRYVHSLDKNAKKPKKRFADKRLRETAEQMQLQEQGDITEISAELSWRDHLSAVLLHMDPYGFERLSQRLLRECGFSNVKVTKKSGDGGIDGTGKLKINGILSFNVAFQCKRYAGSVGAPEIRDFRGSLTTDIEKGVFITTGTFSQAAKAEALSPGKQQIDLIDGEEFISKLAEYSIGVREVKTYEVDDTYFQNV